MNFEKKITSNKSFFHATSYFCSATALLTFNSTHVLEFQPSVPLSAVSIQYNLSGLFSEFCFVGLKSKIKAVLDLKPHVATIMSIF